MSPRIIASRWLPSGCACVEWAPQARPGGGERSLQRLCQPVGLLPPAGGRRSSSHNSYDFAIVIEFQRLLPYTHTVTTEQIDHEAAHRRVEELRQLIERANY